MAKSFKQKTKTLTVTTGSKYDFNSRSVGGRKITFKIHTIRDGLQITRGGRRGGIRGADKAQAGMVVCTAQGAQSVCIRGKDLIVFPGGGAKVAKWARMSGRSKSQMMLNGYSKTNRKSRRSRRGMKRRG